MNLIAALGWARGRENEYGKVEKMPAFYAKWRLLMKLYCRKILPMPVLLNSGGRIPLNGIITFASLETFG
jgi:hypothetical protein